MLSESPIVCFIATSDSDVSKKFYEEILGLKLVSIDPYAVVFDGFGTMLRIQIVDKVEPHPYTTLGWAVADIEKEAGLLRTRGLKFEQYKGMDQGENGVWKSPSGAKIAWFLDPDKNLLSLTQYD